MTDPTKADVTSTVLCDTHGCRQAISIQGDISEDFAADIAEAHGWSVQHGTSRISHHCPRHGGK